MASKSERRTLMPLPAPNAADEEDDDDDDDDTVEAAAMVPPPVEVFSGCPNPCRLDIKEVSFADSLLMCPAGSLWEPTSPLVVVLSAPPRLDGCCCCC